MLLVAGRRRPETGTNPGPFLWVHPLNPSPEYGGLQGPPPGLVVMEMGTRRVKDPLSSGGSTVCYLTLVLKAWGLLGASTQDPLLGPPSIAGFCSPPLPKPVLLPNQLPSTSQGRDEFNRAEQELEVTFTAPLKIKDEFSSQTKHRLVHTSGTHPPGGHLATAGQWEACVLEQVGSTAEGSSGITLWMQTPQRPVCMAEEEEEQEEEEQEVQEVLYMHSNVAVLV
ncbi:unnamed protein product [Boreogadus saida]